MSKKNKKDTGVSISAKSGKSKKNKTPRPPVLRPVRFKKRTTYDRKQSRVRKDENNDQP